MKELATFVFKAKKETDWWIDLTGNATNAILIKYFMSKHLVQTTIRGGKGLTDIPLPNRADDNEYDAQKKIADFFQVQYDLQSVIQAMDQKCVQVPDNNKKTILAVISTPCKWRCWNLENYEKLFREMPEYTFICTGFRSQLKHESDECINRILTMPNVISYIDKSSLTELIQLTNSVSLVLSPDTSVAHIANLLKKSGVLLFGPGDSDRWAMPSGHLRLIHHKNCKFYPCVQWHCRNPHNSCMANITVEEVKNTLLSLF